MPAPDYTGQFNTQLTPKEEAAYQEWALAQGRARDTYDYDLRGLYQSGGGFGADGHATDRFKKPNHPTFSDQSMYARGGPYQGGSWAGDQFTQGPTNVQMHGPLAQAVAPEPTPPAGYLELLMRRLGTGPPRQ